MVHRAPAFRFLVVLEHRKIDHPQRLPAGLRMALLVPIFTRKAAQGVVHAPWSCPREEHEVAVLRPRALDDRLERRSDRFFNDRRLHAVAAFGDLVELDPGETLGSVDADELGVESIAPRVNSPPFGTRRPATRWPGVFAGPENTLNSTDFIASVSSVNLSGTPQVGLVRAVVRASRRRSSSPAADRESATPSDSLNTLRIRPSKIARISISPRNEVSQSIWVIRAGGRRADPRRGSTW